MGYFSFLSRIKTRGSIGENLGNFLRENLGSDALKRSVDGGFVKNGGPQNYP